MAVDIGNHPLFRIFSVSEMLFPGADKVYVIVDTQAKSPIQAWMKDQSIDSPNKSPIPLNPQHCYDRIEEMMCGELPFEWVQPNEVPFEERDDRLKQLNVFDEIHSNILLLRFFNSESSRHDLVLVWFNRNMVGFGPIKPDKLLTTENKYIIGSILHNSVGAQIRYIHNKDNEIVSFNKQVKQFMNMLHEKENTIISGSAAMGAFMLETASALLMSISSSDEHFTYHFSKGAEDRIRKFAGNHAQLVSVISNAVHFAKQLNFDTTDAEIEIEEAFLEVFPPIQQQESENTETGLSERYFRTIALLDKLEKAAMVVISKKMELTGALVGKACADPISAPAITDALKKHRSKILHLFNQYPDRWKTLRNEFKPVRNIMVEKAWKQAQSA